MENDNLQKIRHSLAHLLAAAVLEIYPETKNAIGPAIDDGFYYDFEFKSPLSDKELEKIEKKMREVLKTWKGFEKKEIEINEAQEVFKDNSYKLELIEEHGKDSQLTLYTSGDFTDLCRGGHVDDAQTIDPLSFKLDRIAGAYWRGD